MDCITDIGQRMSPVAPPIGVAWLRFRSLFNYAIVSGGWDKPSGKSRFDRLAAMWVDEQEGRISALVWRLLLILSISFLLIVPEAWSGDTDSETIEANTSAIQMALKSHGLDPGPIDGVMGPATRQAVSAFQETVGLPVTGQLDRQTFEALFETVSSVPVPPVKFSLLEAPPGSEDMERLSRSEPHSSQRATWPPSAAVRQLSMTDITYLSSELVPDAAADRLSSDLGWGDLGALRYLGLAILVIGGWWLVTKVSRARARSRGAHRPVGESTSRQPN